MSDLIKREDAIKAVAQDLMYESCIQSEYASDELSDWIEVAKVMLEEVPSADRPQEWIPCSERLPKWKEHTDDMVLVCYADGSVRFNTFMNWQWVQGEPIAWMPLPKPWKGADHKTENSSEKPNNLSEIPTDSERSSE